jgi:hypothetical protein
LIAVSVAVVSCGAHATITGRVLDDGVDYSGTACAWPPAVTPRATITMWTTRVYSQEHRTVIALVEEASHGLIQAIGEPWTLVTTT